MPVSDIKKYLVPFIGIVVGVAFIAFIWSWVTSPLIITVTGVGETNIPVTTTSLVLSTSSTDASPQFAINSLKSKVATLKGILKSTGIEADSILESQLSVVPRISADQTTSLGFIASLSLGAKGIPAEKIEIVIPSLYGAGATLITQANSSSDDQKGLDEKALEVALKDANDQAGMIARKNWKLITKMIAMTQTTTPATTITGKSDSGSDNAASPGTFKITKTVSESYKMW